MKPVHRERSMSTVSSDGGGSLTGGLTDEADVPLIRSTAAITAPVAAYIPARPASPLKANKVNKDPSAVPPLPSPIERIYYVNQFGGEILPPPRVNTAVSYAIKESEAIVYAMGSLYTSVIPSLVPLGVGECVRECSAKKKILILNGCQDRETHGMKATDYVVAIAKVKYLFGLKHIHCLFAGV